MRRGITRQKTEELLSAIREKIPGIAIRTTLIAGHPGETEADFEEMMKFVETSRFDRLGVFTYSHEENTHSYSMVDDVDNKVKQERADAVMKLQESISLEINQKKIGQSMKVLIDREEENTLFGRTEHDSPEVDNEVIISNPGTMIKPGEFVNVEITDTMEFDLFGTLKLSGTNK